MWIELFFVFFFLLPLWEYFNFYFLENWKVGWKHNFSDKIHKILFHAANFAQSNEKNFLIICEDFLLLGVHMFNCINLLMKASPNVS